MLGTWLHSQLEPCRSHPSRWSLFFFFFYVSWRKYFWMPLYAVLGVIAAFLALIEGGVGIWVAHKDTRKNHELDLIGQCFAYPVWLFNCLYTSWADKVVERHILQLPEDLSECSAQWLRHLSKVERRPYLECYHHLEYLDTYFNRNTLSSSTSTMVQVTDGLFIIFILIPGIMINHLNPSGTSINLRSDELLTLYAIFIFCILQY
jgi:hypothetical protein